MLCNKYKEIILYLFFGFWTFFISVISFGLFDLYFQINELIANILSWFIAVLFAYFTNRKWVFNNANSNKTNLIKQCVNFYLGRIATLLIEEGILLICITILKFSSITTKSFSQVIVILLNYFISKLWIFRRRES